MIRASVSEVYTQLFDYRCLKAKYDEHYNEKRAYVSKMLKTTMKTNE